MKKPVNLLLIFIVVICIVGGSLLAVFLLPKNKDDDIPPYVTNVVNTKYFDVLRVDDYSQLNKYCSSNEMPVQVWEENKLYRLANIPINSKFITLVYETNNEGVIKRITGSSEFEVSSKDEMFYILESVKLLIADFFGMENLNNYHVYNKDGGELDIDKMETYDCIAKGESTFSVTIIDSKSKFWNLKYQYSQDNIVKIEFFCSSDKSIYEDGSEDYNFAEPKE